MRKTTEEEKVEGKRRDIPLQGTSEGTAGRMDGTPSEINTTAEVARGIETATRWRQQETTRWGDPPGNLNNINTTKCKHH